MPEDTYATIYSFDCITARVHYTNNRNIDWSEVRSKVLIIQAFSFSMSLSFYTPIFASFLYSAHNLNNANITIMFACFSISTFLFEIPTGLLADKIGEKKSLFLGSVLVFISTLLFVASDSLFLLYMGEILLGIGNTFFTGSFDVLLYQYCKNDKSVTYSRFMSQSYTLQYMALFSSFLTCSLFTIYASVSAPFIATLIANFVTLVLAFFLPNYRKDHMDSMFTILNESLLAIRGETNLRTICLVDALYSMLLVCGYQLIQPYLSDSTIPSSGNGLLYLSAALLGSVGSFLFGKFDNQLTKSKEYIRGCIFLTMICFFFLSFSYNTLIVVIVFCCYRLVWGLSTPILVFYVNKAISSDSYRDTVFSIVSLTSNLMGAILLFLMGLLKTSANTNYIIMGIISFILFMVFPNHNKREV